MASTFEGWTEGMVFSILFVIIFGGVVIFGMNDLHSGGYAIEGLNTSTIESNFESYQESSKASIEAGEASFLGTVGLVLKSSWDIISSLFTMLMFFVGGGWIETVVSYMQLPEVLGWALRGLYLVTLGFIILRILFKDRV